MACRDMKKANKAAAKIIEETQNKSVFVEEIDLADLASIRNFADRFRTRFGRLDILVNNAGSLCFKQSYLSQISNIINFSVLTF